MPNIQESESGVQDQLHSEVKASLSFMSETCPKKRADETVQWVKVLVAKPGDLSQRADSYK